MQELTILLRLPVVRLEVVTGKAAVDEILFGIGTLVGTWAKVIQGKLGACVYLADATVATAKLIELA
jgi:hypothetical protein